MPKPSKQDYNNLNLAGKDNPLSKESVAKFPRVENVTPIETNEHYDVFICYRRTDALAADGVYNKLTGLGYSVYRDTSDKEDGNYLNRSIHFVKNCKDFIVICTDGCMEWRTEGTDVFFNEIWYAVNEGKNNIPALMSDKFSFPSGTPDGGELFRENWDKFIYRNVKIYDKHDPQPFYDDIINHLSYKPNKRNSTQKLYYYAPCFDSSMLEKMGIMFTEDEKEREFLNSLLNDFVSEIADFFNDDISQDELDTINSDSCEKSVAWLINKHPEWEKDIAKINRNVRKKKCLDELDTSIDGFAHRRNLKKNRVQIEQINLSKRIKNNLSELGFLTVGEYTNIKNLNEFSGISKDEQNKVLSAIKDYEEKVKAEEEAKKKAAEDFAAAKRVVDEIGKLTNITLESENFISSAENNYKKLSPDQQKLVTNYDALSKASTTLSKLKEEQTAKLKAEEEARKKEAADLNAANRVISEIIKLANSHTITLNSEEAISSAKSHYGKLTPDQQKLVSNYDALIKADKIFVKLKDEFAANKVEGEIGKFINSTRYDEMAIVSARNNYDGLTSDQKKLVSNYDLLVYQEALTLHDNGKIKDAFKKFKESASLGNVNAMICVGSYYASGFDGLKSDILKARYWYNEALETDPDNDIAKKYVNDLKKAIEVISEIKNLPLVSLENEQAFIKIKKKHNNLTDEQKKYVLNYDDLAKAEKKLSKLKDEQAAKNKAEEEARKKAAKDYAVAKKVIDEISKLTNITFESYESVSSTRKQYDNLAPDQQKLVSNYDDLVRAEKQLSTIDEKSINDLWIAFDVMSDIKELSPVSLEKEESIFSAKERYNDLTPEQKELVSNYNDLVKAEKKLSILKNEQATKSKAEEDVRKKETAYKQDFKVGDFIKFGKYIQKNANAKDDIEWIVLAKEYNRLLLISRYALDCQQYNKEHTSVTWEKCTLREWLNDTFFKTAFGSAEQTMIKSTIVTAEKNPSYGTDPGKNTTDKIFLLSITEAKKYFSSDDDRMCVPTAYAIEQGAYTSSSFTKGGKATCSWWLRSPGFTHDCAAWILYNGGIHDYGNSVSYKDVCVRPALWIDITDNASSKEKHDANDKNKDQLKSETATDNYDEDILSKMFDALFD